jgi:hypothetical protein
MKWVVTVQEAETTMSSAEWSAAIVAARGD